MSSTMRSLSEVEIEKALDYLRDNAEDAAMARANRLYMEEYRKVVKAQIMSQYDNLPLGAQERNAYSDPAYIDHLKAMHTAIEQDEKHRFLLSAANAKIDAWRTHMATERSMKL